MHEKTSLKEHIEKNLEEIKTLQKDMVNGMLSPELAGYDEEEGSVSLKFTVLSWETNKVLNIHGGILATMMDMTAGFLARYYAGENFAPTASLDIKYLRPAGIGDKLIVTAKKMNSGKRLIQQEIEIVNGETGKRVAFGSTIHLNADTDKEHR